MVCCSKAKQISDYLDKSKWTKSGQQMKTKVVVVETIKSVGDALRHLNEMDVIHSDFVLISGDVISNIKLATVLKTHKWVLFYDLRGLAHRSITTHTHAT